MGESSVTKVRYSDDITFFLSYSFELRCRNQIADLWYILFLNLSSVAWRGRFPGAAKHTGHPRYGVFIVKN